MAAYRANAADTPGVMGRHDECPRPTASARPSSRREGTAMRHSTGEHTPGTSGYDAELRRHNEVLRRAAGVRLHDHVLDIGCGTGQTTRQAARTARAGSALGVDVSATAIKRAHELARAEGL